MSALESMINPIISSAIEEGRIVGASILVAKEGKIIFEQCAGFADREERSLINDQTLFRLASMTKPIVSAATLVLVEQGVISLDVPITQWLPRFTPRTADGKIPVITVRHLLTHTAGLQYGFLSIDNEPYYSAGVSDGLDETGLSLEENLQHLERVPLLFEPGQAWAYSLATDVLGALLEKACNKSLPDIIAQYITEPLGMKDTTFYVKEVERLTRAYADSDSGQEARLMRKKDTVLFPGRGPIHYAPDRITNFHAYPSGGTGMAGTAKDYLIFLETIRCGGKPILNANSVKFLTEDAVPALEAVTDSPGYGFGMGFAVIRDPQIANTPKSQHSYEWGGIYGTKMFVDPAMALSVVICTNTALEGLTGKFTVSLTNALYEALRPKFVSSANKVEAKIASPQFSFGMQLSSSAFFKPPSPLRTDSKKYEVKKMEMK